MIGVELFLSPEYVHHDETEDPLRVQCDVCFGMYQASMTLNYQRIQFFTLCWRVR